MLQNEIRNAEVDWNRTFETGGLDATRQAITKRVLEKVRASSEGHTQGLDYGPLERALTASFDQIAGIRENRYRMNLIERRALEAFRLTAKPEKTAESIVAGFARTQSDTPDFSKAPLDPIRQIVKEEFQREFPSQPPDKGPWKAKLVDKLQKAKLNESTAGKLADIIWREHQSRAAVRDMRAAELATNRGSLQPLVEAILATPLRDQAKPGWEESLAAEYFRNAGLSETQAKTAATVFAKQYQERVADAREAAARRVIEKSPPWERLMRKVAPAERKKIASDVDRVIAAVRAGATDPSRVFPEEIAKANGWAGFTKADHERLSELDSLINNPDTTSHQVVKAQNEILRMVENSKVPRTVWENLASAFHNSLLSGTPTFSVNIFGPYGFMFRDMVTDIAQSVMSPARIPNVMRAIKEAAKNLRTGIAMGAQERCLHAALP